ncbi:hypothetical protein ACFXHA_43050 [Nocardia sp. NPDC059240]|uniref:hypothetical protein n=1 Tax=Nocardia sp. NPDC059240 TaxID=3346786 RepID=UPI0036AC1305
MTDSEVLAAEYRAFVKALHPASIEVLVVVDGFWSHRLYPSIPQEHEEMPERDEVLKVFTEYKSTVTPQLLTLVSGHPDPDVRDAAEMTLSSLGHVIMFLAHLTPNEVAGGAARIEKVLDNLKALRNALYRAPFRIERPEPRFTGELLQDFAIRTITAELSGLR